MSSSIRFNLDLEGFGRQISLLAAASKRMVADVVRDQARLTARDVIKSTPPHGKRPIMEDWTFQRRKGEQTIESDVHRLFSAGKSIRAIMYPSGLSHKARNMRRFYLRMLADQGKWDRITEALFGMHVTTHRVPIIQQLTKAAYRPEWSKWQKKGRIPKNVASETMVWDADSIKKTVKEIGQKVGFAKAGWLKAAEALKLERLPSWITRHGDAPGSFQDLTKDTSNPSFVLSNEVPYIAYLNAGNRLLKRALHNRQRAMEIQTEHAIENFVERFKEV